MLRSSQGSEPRMASRPLDVFMHCVYLIRSECAPLQRYIGLTDDAQVRLTSHNSGANPHTLTAAYSGCRGSARAGSASAAGFSPPAASFGSASAGVRSSCSFCS